MGLVLAFVESIHGICYWNLLGQEGGEVPVSVLARAEMGVERMDMGELVELMAQCATEVGRRVAIHTYGTSQIVDPRAPGKGADLKGEGAPGGSAGGGAADAVNLAGSTRGEDVSGRAAPTQGAGKPGMELSLRDAMVLDSVEFQRDLLVAASTVADQARGVAGLAAVRVEASGVWEQPGVRSFTTYLIGLLAVRYGTAKDMVGIGRLIRDVLPAIGRGILTGMLRWDHAVAGRHAATSQQRRDALAGEGDRSVWGESATGEEVLAFHATTLDAGAFRKVATHFATRTDPEADERGYRDAVEREYLVLAPTMGGYHLQGFLTEDNGKLVSEAIRSVMGLPAAKETRTMEQRRAQGLADLAGLVLTQGLVGSNQVVRPHLIVTVDYRTFAAALTQAGIEFDPAQLTGLEPAQWADGSGPVPPGVLERLACDSQVTRVIFGPGGEVLNYGRKHRRFTGQQRAALIARDKHCQFPGCTAPPILCDGHHVDYWSNGGGTNLDNAILVCSAHHRHIHTYDIEVRYEPDGTWGFYLPDGTQVQQEGDNPNPGPDPS